MALTANFETGVNGNTIATTDAGGLSAWDAVTIGTGATIIYDNTNTYNRLAAKLTTGSTIGVNLLIWNSSSINPNITNHYGRFYLYITANPTLTRGIMRVRTGGSISCRMAINNSGQIVLLDSATTTQATSTNSVGTNQWVRIEYHFIHSTTAGFMEAKLFNTADSKVATETVSTAANINTAADANELGYGNGGGSDVNFSMWYDNILGNFSSYPGPASFGLPTLLNNYQFAKADTGMSVTETRR